MSTINPPAASQGGTVQSRGAQPTEIRTRGRGGAAAMIWGMHISRAVYVAAELGIADLLADGPVSSHGTGPGYPHPRALAVPRSSPARRARRVRHGSPGASA